MAKYILLLIFSGTLLSFVPNAVPKASEQFATTSVQDTVPVKITEKLIQQLSSDLNEKTWRDSGYYFQLENVFWTARRLGVTSNGDAIILASFSSSDPSSLIYRGEAVFRFPSDKWPADISPAKGMTGEAIIALPQDVLYCPSPSQEIGLGQDDPNFPLFLTGQITGVDRNGDFRYFDVGMSVQLRNLEVIL
jgi:hypothetical protein